MIIREKSEGYDGSHRLVMYELDSAGKLTEQSRKSDLDDQIATFYEQRKLEMERLERQVVAGEISPIALCMTYQQLTLPDLASRARLSKRQVRSHLTPAGFRSATVEQLQRYARVFDLAVADLFQFLHLDEGVSAVTANRCERLVQTVEVSFTSTSTSTSTSTASTSKSAASGLEAAEERGGAR